MGNNVNWIKVKGWGLREERIIERERSKAGGYKVGLVLTAGG